MLREQEPKGIQAVGAAYAAAVLCLLPLYMCNGYIGLIDGKAVLFYFLTLSSLALFTVYAIACGRRGVRCVWDTSLTWLAALCAVYALNTLLAQDPQTAFWGLLGRGNGFFMILLCAAGCWLVKNTVRRGDTQLLLTAFLCSAAAAAALGWLNYFMCDPLDVYYALKPENAHMFLSTVGNINFFGALLAMSAPAAIYLCTQAKDKKHTYIYGALAALLCSGLIPANSDGAWLGFFAALMALLCFKRTIAAQAARIFGIGAVVSAVGLLTGAAAKLTTVRGPLRTVSALLCAPAVAAGVGLLCVFMAWRLRKSDKDWTRVFRWSVLAAAAAVLLLLLLVNGAGVSFGPVEELLRFGPRWGSNRGYVWGRLGYVYLHELTPLQKLIGVGGDGVDALLNPHYTQYIAALNGDTFDSAHNVYLQHLLCGGLLGAISWCAFWLKSISGALKAEKVFALPLIAYCVQAFFSIDMPAVLPLAFVFAAMGGPLKDGGALKEQTKKALWLAGGISAAGILFGSLI